MLTEFFTGFHQHSTCHHIESAFISVMRLLTRKSPFKVGRWVMDSGAFTALKNHGDHVLSVKEYADQIRRWKHCGTLLAAVTQDYMCEKFMLAITGLTVADHQRLTIERYDALVSEETGVYIMPVLQGYNPEEYVSHLRQYGNRLVTGQWVGVGSVCKRNGSPSQVLAVLTAIKKERPDIRLHGFGLKITALRNPEIRSMLDSADSMAWSFAARKRGLDSNHHSSALEFKKQIDSLIISDHIT